MKNNCCCICQIDSAYEIKKMFDGYGNLRTKLIIDGEYLVKISAQELAEIIYDLKEKNKEVLKKQEDDLNKEIERFKSEIDLGLIKIGEDIPKAVNNANVFESLEQAKRHGFSEVINKDE